MCFNLTNIDPKIQYWIEASGPITHWEEKYGAIKIPNVYVPTILQKNNDITLGDDGYSYIRNIPVLGENIPIEKVMFGFADDEILNKIIRQDKIQETEQLIEQLIGTDESRSLYEAHELKYYSRPVTLLKIMELIEDRYYNNLLFHNITVKTKRLMERLISECKTIEIPKFIKNEFTQLQDEMDLILSCANVMKFHRLF